MALQKLGGLLNKRTWSPTLRVPGFPLFRKQTETNRRGLRPSHPLCLLAWIRPTSLTSSSFPVSEPRQGLRIRAASPEGFCGTLGPAGPLRGSPEVRWLWG